MNEWQQGPEYRHMSIERSDQSAWNGLSAPLVPGHLPYGADTIGVVGVALVDELDQPTRLLAARRRDLPPDAPAWELPGGKVEPEEVWEAAACREILEELGVHVRLGDFLPGPLYGGLWPLTSKLAMGVWLAQIERGEPQALEHSELRWLSRRELFDVAWLPGDEPIVDRLASRMTG